MSETNIDDLLGEETTTKTKGAKVATATAAPAKSTNKRAAQANAVAESAARIMQEQKAKKAKKDAESLMGGSGKKPAAKKTVVAKAAAPAKTAAPAKAAKPAKETNGSAERGKRGEGKYYFPKTSPEFEALKKKVLSKLKEKTQMTDFAKSINEELWKVRLVTKHGLALDKQIKMAKEGNRLFLIPR